jgi:VanZ family protein
MAAIFVASSLARLPASPGGLSDKQAHALTYAALAALTLRALAGGRWHGVRAGRAVLAVLVAVLYGASDEWHQSFVPGRHAEVGDLQADALGASAAASAVWAWGIIRRFSSGSRGASPS